MDDAALAAVRADHTPRRADCVVCALLAEVDRLRALVAAPEMVPLPDGSARPAPCPFDGGRPWLSRVERAGYAEHPDEPDRWAYSVRCVSCAAAGPWQKSATGALRWWAMRVDTDDVR